MRCTRWMACLSMVALALLAAPGTSRSLPEPDSVQALAARIVPVVESLRGLRFDHQVPVEVVDDSLAALYFTARLQKFYPEDELRLEARAYEQLGLLPPGTDVPKLMLDILGEQAGGYYDPSSGAFYVLGDVPAAILEVVLAHELTHALDDQHFDIDSTLTALESDEDRQSAFGAIVEGSGTLVMTSYVLGAVADKRLGLESLLELQESEFGKAELLEAAPPVIRRVLLAPYVLGQAFLLRGDPMAIVGGIDATDIDQAFRDPPASTEQILHPEKYWDVDHPDPPRALPALDLSAAFGRGWTRRSSGVLGELLVALVTGAPEPPIDTFEFASPESWTNPGAMGWGNDRWELWSDGARWVTVLLTLWDSDADAEEFLDALQIADAHVARRRDGVVVLGGETAGLAARLTKFCLDALAPE
jgi:hypothetical protein